MSLTITTQGTGDTLVFLIGVEQSLEEFSDLENVTLVNITGFDWNGDLSPWYMDKVFKKGEDFAGNADQLLEQMTREVFEPFIEQYQPKETMIVGYSLAGLFALYAATQSTLFDTCASISGSLWYKDWVSYLKDHPVHVKRVYLSLGDTEKNTKNPILSTVEEKTLETQAIIQAYAPCQYESNPGNHMTDEVLRMKKGIRALS